MDDLLMSGVSYEMIEYGEDIEGFIANSQDETLKKFWRNKLPGTYGLNFTKVS